MNVPVICLDNVIFGEYVERYHKKVHTHIHLKAFHFSRDWKGKSLVKILFDIVIFVWLVPSSLFALYTVSNRYNTLIDVRKAKRKPNTKHSMDRKSSESHKCFHINHTHSKENKAKNTHFTNQSVVHFVRRGKNPHTFSNTFSQVETISRWIPYVSINIAFLYLIPSTEVKHNNNQTKNNTELNEKERTWSIRPTSMYYDAWESFRNSHQSIKYIHIIGGLCVLQMLHT